MPERRRFSAGLVLVLCAVVLVYAPSLNDYFAGDDFLVTGPIGRMGALEAIGRAFIMRDGIPYWRPLVTPIYVLYVHGFGLAPLPYHLVVVGLHLLNVVLVALIARELLQRDGPALAAALLFGLHAAHPLTVAQISSTVELFSVVWYLATVLCALRWLRHRGQPDGRWWYGGALLAFVCALLSKESTASAAGVVTVLFGLRVVLQQRRPAAFARAVAPFWLLALPYIAFAFIAGTDDPTGITRLLYAPGVHIAQNLWWMAARLAVPVGPGQGPAVSLAGHAGAAAVTGAGVVLLLRGSATARLLAAWTLIAMIPLALWRPDMMLGRFTYQAAVPFAMLCAWGGARVVERIRAERTRAAVATALVLVVAVVFGALTVSHNRERTREADSYRLLVAELRRQVPAPPAAAEVLIIDGIWSGPFHALYLEAVAETLYGDRQVRLLNIDPGALAPQPLPPSAIVLRFTGDALVTAR